MRAGSGGGMPVVVCMRLWFVLLFVAGHGCDSGGGSSTTPPPPDSGGSGWITLTAPTSGSAYWTDGWTVTLGGEAFIDAWSYSGAVAPSVLWTNAQAGVSGVAADTVEWAYFFWTPYPVRRCWSATVPLVGGTNVITVSATSGGNWARKRITVSRPPGANPPMIAIDPIAPGNPSVTNTTPLVLRGTALGYLGIASVAWTNAATGGAGFASGTTSWSATIPLAAGANAIALTALDPSGAAATGSVTITYDPAQAGPFPPAPTGVIASAGDGAVTVQWNAVPEALAYNLYWAASAGVSKSTYASLPGGASAQGVSSPYTIGGLVNGTAYHCIVTAVDAVGEGVESAEAVATPVAGTIGVVTGDAGAVTASSARLNGNVSAPVGFATSAWFEYGPTTAYGWATPAQPVTAGATSAIAEDLSGLAAGTMYHFRAAAHNATGTFTGADRSFFTPRPPEVLVSGLDAAVDLAVDSASVYWIEIYGDAVKKVPPGGGDVTVLVSLDMGGNRASLAIDPTHITFADYGTIWQAPLGGGAAVPVIGGRQDVYVLRAAGASVYWRESGAVRMIDVPSGTMTTLATGPTSPVPFQGGLAVDDDGVYWTDWEKGLLQSCPRGGGAVTTLASGLDRPYALLVDAGTLYFAERTSIRKAPAAGGAVAVVAAGISPWHLAKDATHLYWTDGGRAIRKAELASGVVATLVDNEPGFHGLAVDETSVYWLTPGDRFSAAYGSLKKIPKD